MLAQPPSSISVARAIKPFITTPGSPVQRDACQSLRCPGAVLFQMLSLAVSSDSATGNRADSGHELVFFPDFRTTALVNDRYGFSLPAGLVAADLKRIGRRVGRHLRLGLACTAAQQPRHD